MQRRFGRRFGIRSAPHGWGALALSAAITALAAGCSDEAAKAPSSATAEAKGAPSAPPATAPKPAAPEATLTPEQLIAEGRATYNANCIACHAMDPTVDGALGPAVAGSSPELIEARVLRGEYPPGYQPKRPSRVMVALPHLEPKLSALAAYLGSLSS